MKAFLPLLTGAITALCMLGAAQAQTPSTRSPLPVQAQAPATCLNDISKFEQSIAMVRQVSGERAAAELREKLLPSSQASEILSENGPCGLSRHLRTRKLV